jgi:hypothetical protein
MNTSVTKTEQILDKCHELMADGMSRSVAAVMNEMDDMLFDMLRHCGPEEHACYAKAMRELRLKRAGIESGFREKLNRVISHSTAQHATGSNHNSEKGLPDQETDLEESLALNKTQGRISKACQQALLSLDERMHFLLHGIRVEEEECVAYPETICQVFREACSEIESGVEIRLFLFKLFEKYASAGLQEICVAMDTCLDENIGGLNDINLPEDNNLQLTGQGRHKRESGAGAGIPVNRTEQKDYFIIARRIVRSQIQGHLAGTCVPDFIRMFLHEHWSKLLFKIHIRDGKNTRAWHHAVEVIDDLIRSVDPDVINKENDDIAQKLPNLIQRLKYGMNVIPVPAEIRDGFIRELRQYHKALLEQELEQEQAREAQDQPDMYTLKIDSTVPQKKAARKLAIPFMDELFVDK